MLGTPYGVRVALPTAGPRGEGRSVPPPRKGPTVEELGLPGRAIHAPRGGAQDVATPRRTTSKGEPGDVVTGKERPIPATGGATPTTSIRVVRVLARLPERAPATGVATPGVPFPSPVATGPETLPSAGRAIPRVRPAPRASLPFRHRETAGPPLAAPSAPGLAAPRPRDLAVGPRLRLPLP